MMQMLADVPPVLVIAWVTWFVAGGALAMWYRRASLELEYAPVARPVARARPASRPPSGVRREPVAAAPIEEAPLGDTSHFYEPPPALAPPAPREKAPMVIGDPFGDLATLLDQAQPPVAAPAPHRAPGDSPILSSSGFPVRRANDEPKLS